MCLDEIGWCFVWFASVIHTTPAWISKHKAGKVWHEITYPSPNFILEMDISFHLKMCDRCSYLSIMGLKLFRVSKMGPGFWDKETNEKIPRVKELIIPKLQPCSRQLLMAMFTHRQSSVCLCALTCALDYSWYFCNLLTNILSVIIK